jgi:hypothetical protein
MLLQEVRDVAGGKAHQRDREHETEDQDVGMLARRTRDCEHIVERHRDVGDEDLPGRLAERLLRGAATNRGGAVRVDVEVAEFASRLRHRVPQLPPHLPANPQQQNAAGKQQADDRQQLCRDGCKADAQHSRGADADEDCARTLFFRQAGGRKTDDHRVVARQHQVDHDDLEKRRQRRARE